MLTVTVGGDITAPTTSAGPSVSGTTDTATTLSVTINENGTGYYLVQAAAAAAPSVATVQASGTSFAMTANVAATPAISGLTASTAYAVYFVAKDAANNVQVAVQSVAVTTPDTTPPATPATLALTGNAGASAGYSITQNISLNVADVADPSGVLWFVAESASAPVAGDAGWSSTKPTTFTLSAGDGAKSVYVYVRDNLGNVQPTGKTASIVLDTTPPTAPAGNEAMTPGETRNISVTFNEAIQSAAAITVNSGTLNSYAVAGNVLTMSYTATGADGTYNNALSVVATNLAGDPSAAVGVQVVVAPIFNLGSDAGIGNGAIVDVSLVTDVASGVIQVSATMVRTDPNAVLLSPSTWTANLTLGNTVLGGASFLSAGGNNYILRVDENLLTANLIDGFNYFEPAYVEFSVTIGGITKTVRVSKQGVY